MLMALFCADVAVIKNAAAMWQMAELCVTNKNFLEIGKGKS
jgi:hypothetical protein